MKKLNRRANLLIRGWFLVIFFLFLYSFTQIDLGLTLTRASWWQIIQKNFQFIGYFKRPLSAGLYLSILFFLFLLYFLIVKAVKEGWLKRKKVWFLILATSGFLWLSYNAFSYDLFNYIFDAKVITYYQQSPYQLRALDFPEDPMLGFMHWTHRLYPYGPTWLALTVPLSVLGFQKLLPTLILFKFLAVTGYLVAVWFLYKILEKIRPEEKFLGLAVFAFSPLMILESLVSGHNDIWMMALALVAFWFLVNKKYFWSGLMFVLSAGIKFATGSFLLPLFLVWLWRYQGKKINWDRIWWLSLFLMIIGVFLATKRTNFQPWYLLYPLPFMVLLSEKNRFFWLIAGISLGALLQYAPFLYLGNWDPPVPIINFGLIAAFSVLGIIVFFWKQKINLRKLFFKR